MYINANTIITLAALLTAVGTILGIGVAFIKWLLQQKKQDTDIKKLKEEQGIICYALLACLDGLKQLGANGNVTDAHNKLEKHINNSAHET